MFNYKMIIVFLCILYELENQIIELTENKQTLEKEMEEALVYLKEMNKIEKKSIEVNQYETSQEIQQYE